MAKRAGHIKITGIIGNVTYYKTGREYYARMKSSLTRKQLKTKKCFEGSRRSTTRLGAWSKIARKVYGSVPDKVRVYTLFCLLRSKAVALLKQGLDETNVKIALQQPLKQLQRNTTEAINSALMQFYSLTFFPVTADSRAASSILTTITLFSSDEGSFTRCISPLNTPARYCRLSL